MTTWFDESFLQALIRTLDRNPVFLREAKLASFTIGFADESERIRSWIRFSDGEVSEYGVGQQTVDFYLMGKDEYWEQLRKHMPLNRLVRRGELKVRGNVRHCMKNWKMIWLIGQIAKEVEV